MRRSLSAEEIRRLFGDGTPIWLLRTKANLSDTALRRILAGAD
jgi:hypothetical protein